MNSEPGVAETLEPVVPASHEPSSLDRKILQHFAGLVVRKDLTKGLKQNAVSSNLCSGIPARPALCLRRRGGDQVGTGICPANSREALCSPESSRAGSSPQLRKTAAIRSLISSRLSSMEGWLLRSGIRQSRSEKVPVSEILSTISEAFSRRHLVHHGCHL